MWIRLSLCYASEHVRGCAGISRQLHPLKAKDFLKDKPGVSFSWYLHDAFLCISMHLPFLAYNKVIFLVERYAGIALRLLLWRLEAQNWRPLRNFNAILMQFRATRVLQKIIQYQKSKG